MRFGNLLRVDLDELGGVLVVHEDAAFAIGDGEFRFAAESERAGDGAVGGVDGSGVLAAAIEGEDALADGVVDDGVGIGIRFNCADGLQRLDVEDGYIVRTAVTGEAAAEVGGDGDAVNALRVWDAANDFVRIRVQHNNLGGVRHVDATGVAVHIDVVPAAFAADGNGFDHFITGRAGGGGGGEQKCASGNCEAECGRDCQNCDALVIHGTPLSVRLGLGLMLFEPAGHVKHFSDVVAGATADAVWFLGDADEYGVHIQQFERGVKLFGFGNRGAVIGFAGHN